MLRLMNLEVRRLYGWRILLPLLLLLALVANWYAGIQMNDYEVYAENGTTIALAPANFAYTREAVRGKYWDASYLTQLREQKNRGEFLDVTNANALIRQVYEDRDVDTLTREEMDQFFFKRLQVLREKLETSQNQHYTPEEVDRLVGQAAALRQLPMDFAEGWKILNGTMWFYVAFLLILVSVLVLPLFGGDPEVKMWELCRSTPKGKQPLDRARVLLAYALGAAVYLTGAVLYGAAVLSRCGAEGAGLPIQTNAADLFSNWRLSYGQQFLLNLLVGFGALLLTVTLALLVSALTQDFLNSSVLVVFFWVIQIVFSQMALFSVNHRVLNFLPFQMIHFDDYYSGFELYRVLGQSWSRMGWVLAVTAAVILLAAWANHGILAGRHRGGRGRIR